MDVNQLRMLERIICAGFGGLSLVLGYRLFVLGINIGQAGDIEIAKLKIRSRAFAPGIFFAAFGTLILWSSLNNPVEHESTPIGQAPKGDKSPQPLSVIPRRDKFVGYDQPPEVTPTSPAKVRVMLNALRQFPDDPVFTNTAEAGLIGHEMELIRQKLLFSAFPNDRGSVEVFLKKINGIQVDAPSSPILKEIENAYYGIAQ